ncbi:MAG: fumarylacetoacetate hydrolase family protein [Hyphomicrobiaceae bacterium]|nr:fumarylacetoacetate hydrolase family protein [Hyphomicrobiaceae bacterium]
MTSSTLNPHDRYVIAHPHTPTVAVANSDKLFPVRRIHCVGRNYADHIKEMGNDEREPPIFFQKPADAVVGDGETVPYPTLTRELHFEVELVIAIGKAGRHVGPNEARSMIYGYAIGIDLTRRDLQNSLKSKGQPWEMAKAFDHSAPIGAIHTTAEVGHPERGYIRLDVNGKTRQQGDLSQMIWSIPEIVANLSKSVQLAPGDLIFTGTPAGVGPVVPGDKITAEIHGLGTLTIRIGAPMP